MRSILLLALVATASAFTAPAAAKRFGGRPSSLADDEAPSDGGVFEEAVAAAAAPPDARIEAAALKARIFAACAASDRGFAASAADRATIEALLDDLAPLSPTADPSAGIADGDADAPLRACWRLVYTSASDVSTLAGNPFTQLGGIYQDARELPLIVNVIDLFPRALSALPPNVAANLGTAARLKVTTRARPRSPTRVGLSFERVGAEATSILGRTPPDWLPKPAVPLPQLGLDLQRRVFGVSDDADPRDAESNPAFFDITYLDDDLLVIKQGSPGGTFAAVRVDGLAD